MKITSDVNKHLSGFWLHDTLRRKDHFYLRSTNPKAMAPKAPWVEVCESPQTIVAPGNVIPFSGPDMNDSILSPNPQWLIPFFGIFF
jgi:hypothetical protein